MIERRRKSRRKGNHGRVSTFEYDFLNFLHIINPSNYVNIQTAPALEDDAEADLYNKTMLELAMKRVTPEDHAIIHDLWMKLSPQAKETFLVLSFPTGELSELVGTPKRKDITAKSVVKYAELMGYDADSVMKELKLFAGIYIRILKC